MCFDTAYIAEIWLLRVPQTLGLSETEETKLEKYCSLEVMSSLWYWFIRNRFDLKKDHSRAEYVRFQR